MRKRQARLASGELIEVIDPGPADDPRGALNTRSAAPPIDPCLALLARGREALPDLGQLRAPAEAALTALEQCRRIALTVPERVAGALARARADVERGAQIARRQSTTRDGGDAAATTFTAARELEITDSAAAEFADAGQAAGESAVAKCRAFDDALTRLGLDAEQAFYPALARHRGHRR